MGQIENLHPLSLSKLPKGTKSFINNYYQVFGKEKTLEVTVGKTMISKA